MEALGDVFLGGRPLNVNSSGPSAGGAVAITSRNGLVEIGHVDSSSTVVPVVVSTLWQASNVFTGDLTSRGSSSGWRH